MALSSLTGIEVNDIRQRTSIPLPANHDQAEAVPKSSAFERSQCESILRGDEVEIQPGVGFVLMPHDSEGEFRSIFESAIKPAMAENGIVCKVAGDIFQPGSILNQVWEQIRTAEVIVADVSHRNLNVIYELGLCFGLRRLPIILVRNPEELPFNLRALRYIEYQNTAGGISALRKGLTSSIAEFLAASRMDSPGEATDETFEGDDNN